MEGYNCDNDMEGRETASDAARAAEILPLKEIGSAKEQQHAACDRERLQELGEGVVADEGEDEEDIAIVEEEEEFSSSILLSSPSEPLSASSSAPASPLPLTGGDRIQGETAITTGRKDIAGSRISIVRHHHEDEEGHYATAADKEKTSGLRIASSLNPFSSSSSSEISSSSSSHLLNTTTLLPNDSEDTLASTGAATSTVSRSYVAAVPGEISSCRTSSITITNATTPCVTTATTSSSFLNGVIGDISTPSNSNNKENEENNSTSRRNVRNRCHVNSHTSSAAVSVGCSHTNTPSLSDRGDIPTATAETAARQRRRGSRLLPWANEGTAGTPPKGRLQLMLEYGEQYLLHLCRLDRRRHRHHQQQQSGGSTGTSSSSGSGAPGGRSGNSSNGASLNRGKKRAHSESRNHSSTVLSRRGAAAGGGGATTRTQMQQEKKMYSTSAPNNNSIYMSTTRTSSGRRVKSRLLYDEEEGQDTGGESNVGGKEIATGHNNKRLLRYKNEIEQHEEEEENDVEGHISRKRRGADEKISTAAEDNTDTEDEEDGKQQQEGEGGGGTGGRRSRRTTATRETLQNTSSSSCTSSRLSMSKNLRKVSSRQQQRNSTGTDLAGEERKEEREAPTIRRSSRRAAVRNGSTEERQQQQQDEDNEEEEETKHSFERKVKKHRKDNEEEQEEEEEEEEEEQEEERGESDLEEEEDHVIEEEEEEEEENDEFGYDSDDDAAVEPKTFTRLTTHPSILTCPPKPYQLEGLNWLIQLHERGMNGVLADEMGLGKTYQTISLLSFLKEAKGINGPHLVLAPKSTIGNWMAELRRFCPSLNAVRVLGDKETRRAVLAHVVARSAAVASGSCSSTAATARGKRAAEADEATGEIPVDDEEETYPKIRVGASGSATKTKGGVSSSAAGVDGKNVYEKGRNSYADTTATTASSSSSRSRSRDGISSASRYGWQEGGTGERVDERSVNNRDDSSPLLGTAVTPAGSVSPSPATARGRGIHGDSEEGDIAEEEDVATSGGGGGSISNAAAAGTTAEDDLEALPDQVDVVVTSYEMCILEKAQFMKVDWEYVVIDEAHRIKNETSKLAQTVRLFSTQHRLLLTGTPLQNNLRELWALLNFLFPSLFASSAEFEQLFDLTGTAAATGTGEGGNAVALTVEEREQRNMEIVTRLHRILRPFMLRRVKKEVLKEMPPKKELLLFVPLSVMQKQLYKDLLTKNVSALQGGDGAGRTQLLNLAMQLRKACNHPYLFEGYESENADPFGEHVIENAGKLRFCDRLLRRLLLLERRRCLIFTQMTKMLDILEDYCRIRMFKYCRIDGNTSGDDRDRQIEAFNAPQSDIPIFLLSTRAGGLGINLATADTVILYDSDWNPQVDLQAMDRVHRIGQKSAVNVYRLVHEHTIEEKIIEKATLKLQLDTAIIQQGRLSDQQNQQKQLSKNELMNMVQFGADHIFKSGSDNDLTEEDLEAILARGQARTNTMNEKLQTHVKKSLLDFTINASASSNLYEYDGVDYTDQQRKADREAWAALAIEALEAQNDRESRRRQRLLMKEQEQRQQQQQQAETRKLKHIPRAVRLPPMQEWQFYSRQRIEELHASELLYYRTQGNSKPPTDEEREEKRRLLQEGFGNWGKRDFIQFVRGNEMYGRHDLARIATEVEGKSYEEIVSYAKVFWERYKEIQGWEKWIRRIEEGEAVINKRRELEQVILKRQQQCEAPWRRLPIPYGGAAKSRSVFIEEEDRWILNMTTLLGYGNWTKMRDVLLRDCQWRFDWYMRSRSSTDLGKRAEALIRLLKKEEGERFTRGRRRLDLPDVRSAGGGVGAAASGRAAAIAAGAATDGSADFSGTASGSGGGYVASPLAAALAAAAAGASRHHSVGATPGSMSCTALSTTKAISRHSASGPGVPAAQAVDHSTVSHGGTCRRMRGAWAAA